MRGQLSDNDLTNYALNDGLDESERLYVESLLAVSEECRNDVYNMIELGQMLEEGLGGDAAKPATLTAEQRLRLLNPPQRHPAIGFLKKAAGAVAIAACVALALANPQIRRSGGEGARKVAQVSTKMSQMVVSSVSGNSQDVDFSSLVDFRFDDTPSWLQTASDTLPATSSTICTPPSWPDAMH